MDIRRIFLIAVAALVVLYIGDYLHLRYLMSRSKAAAFGNVTEFDSMTVKGGKTEYFFDQPENIVCVHSLFPHFGDNPCWYARRQTVKSID